MINKKSQIGIEYMLIMAFVTFVLIGIISVAFFYGGGIKDRLKIVQVSNYANKIISTVESVHYYGTPSKATIKVYLPEGINDIQIIENSLFITIQLHSGISKISFPSDVPVTGSLSTNGGVQRISINAQESGVNLNTLS